MNKLCGGDLKEKKCPEWWLFNTFRILKYCIIWRNIFLIIETYERHWFAEFNQGRTFILFFFQKDYIRYLIHLFFVSHVLLLQHTPHLCEVILKDGQIYFYSVHWAIVISHSENTTDMSLVCLDLVMALAHGTDSSKFVNSYPLCAGCLRSTQSESHTSETQASQFGRILGASMCQFTKTPGDFHNKTNHVKTILYYNKKTT